MKDVRTIFGLLVFSVAMIVLVIPAAIPVSFVPPGQIGPRFFPNLLCSAMALISVALLVDEAIKARRRRKMAERDTPDPSVVSDKAPADGDDDAVDNRKAWIAVVIVLGYVLAMGWIGFIPASAVGVIAAMILFGERRWWMMAIFASATPLLTWAFATQVLHLPLP